MKRLFPILVLAVVLAGCAGAPEAISQARFVSLSTALDSYQLFDEDSLDELAEGLCDSRERTRERGDEQSTFESILLATAQDSGQSVSDTGAFLTYATARHCPEFLDAATVAELRG